jgi:hypothetical protein
LEVKVKVNGANTTLLAILILCAPKAISDGEFSKITSLEKIEGRDFQVQFCMHAHTPLPPIKCGIPEKARIVSILGKTGVFRDITWNSLTPEQRDLVIDDLFATIFPHINHWSMPRQPSDDLCPQSGLLPTPVFQAIHKPNATWPSDGPLRIALGLPIRPGERFIWNAKGPLSKQIWDALISETENQRVIDPGVDRFDWSSTSQVHLPRNIAERSYREYPYLAFFLSNPTRDYQQAVFKSAVHAFFSKDSSLAEVSKISGDTALLLINDTDRGCSARHPMDVEFGRLLNFSPNFLQAIMFAIDQNNNPFGAVKCGCFPGKLDW